MSRFNHQREYSAQDIAYRVIAVLLCTVVAIIFIPRHRAENYEVTVGRPWYYRDIIASADYPVYKSEARLQHERDSLRKHYEPYFTLQPGRSAEQLRAFRTEASSAGLSQQSVQYVVKCIDHIYFRGIVNAGDMSTYLKNAGAMRVVTGQESETRLVRELYTPLTAYEYIINNADPESHNVIMLQKINLERYLIPNLTYDKNKSEAALRDLVATIPTSSGMVMAGTKVVGRGDIVTAETASKIESYLRVQQTEQGSNAEEYVVMAGQALYVAILLTVLIFYFELFRRDYMDEVRIMTLLAILVLSLPLITYSLVRHNIDALLIVPYSMVPVFVRIFMDSRTAFVSHIITIMLSAVALAEPFSFIAVEVVTGLVAIYSLRELSERSQIFRAAFFVTIVAALMLFALGLMEPGGLKALNAYHFVSVAAGGLVLACVYSLLYPIERLFGFTSNVTLMELSNTNTPLLRNMAEVAPGTFQHSMQVANLASDVAMKIGAKSLLVRTGALYHDIGKTKNPAFFTENQRGFNPHDALSTQQSAQLITGHVREGLALAEQHRLPTIVRDFIATHHGCGMAKFFYMQAKQAGLEPDPQFFSYPGPNPTTVEQAILMMSDAVEAASRSLKDVDDQSVSDLVDRIIEAQVSEGFFSQCPITFRDIADAKQVFKAKLRTIYHTRIEYPKNVK